MRTSLYPVMPLSLANLTAKCSENYVDESVNLDSSFSLDMSSNAHVEREEMHIKGIFYSECIFRADREYRELGVAMLLDYACNLGGR